MTDLQAQRWQQVRAILDAALDLEPEARRQYLQDLRSEDFDLHRDVSELLEKCERMPPLRDAMELISPAISELLLDDEALDQSSIGQVIGEYRLTRVLGAGGMGAVYLAERSTEGFAQTVALKVVRKAFGTQAAHERFERERQILSLLQHPGIALLFDGGRTPDGQSFYTMEFVDGETITEYCERHGDFVAGRVGLLLQVATTLAYAHANLVVHRDIKPSNVLVTPEGRVKLVDFGVAKLLDQHSIPTVTQIGSAAMTPAYASPEQFLNEATTVATDVYQFGMLCYVVLTGRLPYRADPHDALSWARAVIEADPLPLAQAVDIGGPAGISSAQRSAGRFKRQLTRDLDAIVRKALAKRPESRYRSMDALIADLEAFLSQRPVSARAAGPLYFVWRFVQRRRYAFAAALLATAMVGLAASVAWRQSRTAAENAERAAREAEARGVTRAMLTDVLRVAPASASTQRPKSALEALDQGAERTLRVLNENAQQRAIATGALAETYLDLHYPQRARSLIEQAEPALADSHTLLRADVLQIDLLLARATAELGDLEASAHALDRAERTIEEAQLPPDAPPRLAAGLVHVLLADHAGRLSEGDALAARLLRENDRPGINQTLEFAEILRINATKSLDNAAAALLADRAFKIVAAHYGEDSAAALAAQRLTIQYSASRLEGERILIAQERHFREAFGEDSLDYAEVLTEHCLRKLLFQEYANAEPLCRQAVAIYSKATDSEATQLASALDYEGHALLRLGRPAEALAVYERESTLLLRRFAPTYVKVLQTRLQIAQARCRNGDIEQASSEFDAAMSAFVAEVGQRHLWEALNAARFADCLIDAGRRSEARLVMEDHATLDPPRKDMTAEDRAEVEGAWQRLKADP